MKSIKALTSLLLIYSVLTGCQQKGIVLTETPLNMSETRKAIVAVIGSPQKISENGRELTSKYYDRKGSPEDKAMKAKERLHTIVTIFGDRRPYDIAVLVNVEFKTPEGYEVVGQDDSMATDIANKIKQALNQSRDKRNVIDDFRPY